MSLRDVVVSALVTANKVTAPLQATVQHVAAASISGAGVVTPAAAVARPALVDWKQQAVRTASGQMEVSRAHVTFLEPVTITTQDVITLPDGTTGPILAIGGFVDAVTGDAYYVEVWIG